MIRKYAYKIAQNGIIWDFMCDIMGLQKLVDITEVVHNIKKRVIL